MLTAYHEENPLRDGMKRDEFRSKFLKYEDMAVVDKITDSLVNRKVLKIVNGCVALYDFEAQTDNNQELIEKPSRKADLLRNPQIRLQHASRRSRTSKQCWILWSAPES